MNGSATKSRLKKKRALRRRRKLIEFFKGFFLVCCIVLITVSVIFAIRSGKEVSKNIKYPVEYSDFIVKYSTENELDPYLVIAVIRQESNFIADARSPYAGGLMQLTPVTAEECAGKLGLENCNYMDPETNIRIGCDDLPPFHFPGWQFHFRQRIPCAAGRALPCPVHCFCSTVRTDIDGFFFCHFSAPSCERKFSALPIPVLNDDKKYIPMILLRSSV